MYSFRYCPVCGEITCGSTSAPPLLCDFCKHEKISIKYTGRYEDGSKYGYDHEAPVDEDEIVQREYIIENIVKKNPEFNQQMFDKREEEDKEFWNNMEKGTVEKCPYCGSTNLQLVRKKWSLLTGFFTNKVDRYCVNCKRKV